MKVIYWNTKDTTDIDRIIDIVQHESPELFFLSEIDEDLLSNNKAKLKGVGYVHYLNPGCDRVSIIKKIDLKINLELQDTYYTTLKIRALDLYILSIHMPSQMYRHTDTIKEVFRDFRANIDYEIGGSLEKKILIIGDFNVNPHEDAMIAYDGFLAANSINSRKTIGRITKNKTTYYNPTWQLYNRKHFPGTKYFERPSGSSNDILEFHYLDQVVLSQLLLSSIQNEEIKVIENTPNFSFLCNKKNSVVGSDHLPLSYQFNI